MQFVKPKYASYHSFCGIVVPLFWTACIILFYIIGSWEEVT